MNPNSEEGGASQPPPPPAPLSAPVSQRSARSGPSNPPPPPPPTVVPPPVAPSRVGEPVEAPAPQPAETPSPGPRKPSRRWPIIVTLLACLGVAGLLGLWQAADDDDTDDPVKPSDPTNEPTGQSVAIDTCHFRTAGQSVRCGPASFRETPGGTKLFTVPDGQEVTVLCQSTSSMARNNQQPPTRESNIWTRAQDADGREAWVAAIVLDAWPPNTLSVPEC